MYLINYTMGEDPYDHTKIGDYSRKVIRKEEEARWAYNEWESGCTRALERERASWFSIQMICLETGEVVHNKTQCRPELERKRLNVKPVLPNNHAYPPAHLAQAWNEVEQQPDPANAPENY